MLKNLSVHNFTVFSEQEIRFASGLNVIIGENGTGKSQLMRLAYALASVSHSQNNAIRQNKEDLQRTIADKLSAVCRPESLGRLVSRQQGRNRCEVKIDFLKPTKAGFDFSFATNSKTEVKLGSALSANLEAAPVFFPTREMLSIFPGFAAAYRNRELEFDETYYDLALALEPSPLKGKRPEKVSTLIDEIENIIGGRVLFEKGRFYLLPKSKGQGWIEMPLVAEGIRKFAMMVYLLINGGLRNKSILFWDEPETNLNPKLMQSLAQALVVLAREGIQLVLATHSLFLLRELTIALAAPENKKVETQFIAFDRTDSDVTVSQGKSINEIEPIAMLDADLEQTDRYLASS